MYICILHNWQSISSPCPSCVRTIPSTTTEYRVWNEPEPESEPPTPEVGKGIEEILDKHLSGFTWIHWSKNNAMNAMSEWAAIQCAELESSILQAVASGEDYASKWRDEDKPESDYAKLQKQCAAKDAEIKVIKKNVGRCIAYVNGLLDGLELDNQCDVIEKSYVIKELKELINVFENKH